MRSEKSVVPPQNQVYHHFPSQNGHGIDPISESSGTTQPVVMVGSVVLASTQRGSWCPRASHRGVHWPPERITSSKSWMTIFVLLKPIWFWGSPILGNLHAWSSEHGQGWEKPVVKRHERADHRNHKTVTKCLKQESFHYDMCAKCIKTHGFVCQLGQLGTSWGQHTEDVDGFPWHRSNSLDPLDPRSAKFRWF